jgi:hypothetical protein
VSFSLLPSLSWAQVGWSPRGLFSDLNQTFLVLGGGRGAVEG